MSGAIDHTVLGDRVSLPQLIRGGALPYQTERQARLFLDRLRVPYIVVRRLRQYRLVDIRRAIDHETQVPCWHCKHEHEPGGAGPI